MGLAEGLPSGIAEGIAEGLAERLAKGLAKGLAQGLSKKLAKGLGLRAEDQVVTEPMKERAYAAHLQSNHGSNHGFVYTQILKTIDSPLPQPIHGSNHGFVYTIG